MAVVLRRKFSRRGHGHGNAPAAPGRALGGGNRAGHQRDDRRNVQVLVLPSGISQTLTHWEDHNLGFLRTDAGK
jgi:hypothetical protein